MRCETRPEGGDIARLMPVSLRALRSLLADYLQLHRAFTSR
jgi:hypothetical protein